jgi:predicted permease
MSALINDIKYGFRQLRKNPGFTFVAISSLALGVTLNSAIFSLVDGIWLRSMPFSDPDRVVRIFGSTPEYEYGDLSYPDYLDLREQMESLSGLATCARHGAILEREEESVSLRADVVSRNFFTILGIKPFLGQFFSNTDDSDVKNTQTVVLSYRLWQKYFGGDPNLIGKSIVLTDRTLMVLAIAPPDFNGLERMNPAHVWYPVENDKINYSRDERYLSVFGRLKSEANIRQAQTEAEIVFRRLDLHDTASHKPLRALVIHETEYQRGQTGILGILLLGVVGTILLLACANVSSLLLARAEVREKEMAVRSALGGSRWRLIRQLLVESLILALITMAASLLLAHWVIRVLPVLLPPDAANQVALLVRLDGRVFGFTAAISLFSIVLFGIVPALHASKPDLLPAIKGEAGWGQTGGIKRYCGLKVLVAGQAGIALVLMILATLLTRSLIAQFGAELGFERKDILLVNLSTGNEKEGRQFHRQIKDRVQALPGVKKVCLSRIVPFSPWGTGAKQKIFMSGDPSAWPQDGWSINFNAVDPDYFKLLGIPIVRGRTFHERDNKSSDYVMVINETMAQRFWPNKDPVGQWIRLHEPNGKSVQIIGVVRDTKLYNIKEESNPYIFLPLAQHYQWETTLLVESAVPSTTLAGPVRAELKALGVKPSQSDINTMSGYIRDRLTGEEFLTKMTTIFGLLGLGLASVGLYGVLAYTVNQHTHEIGIRMALGAQRREVLNLFLTRGMTLVIIGTAFGVPIALGLGFALRGLLYNISPVDPLSIAMSLSVMIVVALLACCLPARRAAKIDPMEALRYE